MEIDVIRSIEAAIAVVAGAAFIGGIVGALVAGPGGWAWMAKWCFRVVSTVATVTLAVLLCTQQVDGPKIADAYRSVYGAVLEKLGQPVAIKPLLQDQATHAKASQQATTKAG